MVGLKNELLLELASSLARAWSDNYEVTLAIRSNIDRPQAIAYVEGYVGIKRKYKWHINLKELNSYPTKDLYIAYRLWRLSLWHEAMHVKHTPPELKTSDKTLDGVLAWVMEDWRIENLGIKTYPGMKNEILLANAVYIKLWNNHIVDEIAKFKKDVEYVAQHSERFRDVEKLLRQYCRVMGFIMRMIFGWIPKNLSDKLTDDDFRRIDEAVKYARSELERISNYSQDVILAEMSRLIEDVVRILDVNDLRRFMNTFSAGKACNVMIMPKGEGVKKLGKADVQDAVKTYIEQVEGDSKSSDSKKSEASESDEESDKTSDGSKVSEIIKGDESVRKEFTELINASKAREKAEKADRYLGAGGRGVVRNKVITPRALSEDERQYYNYPLIQHLKAQLQKVKKNWVEIYAKSGDEVDVEEVVRKSAKPFITEDRVKAGGMKVLLLLDFSGSIGPYERAYKTALIAMAEALNFVKCKFAIYAFSIDPHANKVAVYRVKNFDEKWDKISAKRIAQLFPAGGTPLSQVYDMLKPLVLKERPDVFITLTDGMPDDYYATVNSVKQLKRCTRMVALGFALWKVDISKLIRNYERLGYDRFVALDNIHKLPEKVLYILFTEG